MVTYNDAGADMRSILKDNRSKSGVYLWTNKINGKMYVGSSINLGKRLSMYFSIGYLEEKRKSGKSVINIALLKYGYSQFSFSILEYCDVACVLDREQFYLELLKPEYNILQVAGSTLGYKHREETLAKFRDRTLTEEQKAKLLDHLARHNSSEEQRAKSRERMLKINGTKGIQVEVTDIETKVTSIHGSIRKAAEALNTDSKAIRYNQKTQKPFKGRYIIKIYSEK